MAEAAETEKAQMEELVHGAKAQVCLFVPTILGKDYKNLQLKKIKNYSLKQTSAVSFTNGEEWKSILSPIKLSFPSNLYLP